MQRLPRFICFIICMASLAAAIAQELPADGDSIASADSIKWETILEEVVVTGSFEPQSMRESVFQIRTISAERINSQGATNLQAVLQNELNIRFEQDLALGESRISMQGLSGQNVKVLIDGVPVIGRQGTSNAVNLNQFNVNSIDRVEVVEGPMSVVYGADAIAGVINIITKKEVDGKLNIGLRLHEETVGKAYGKEEGIHNQSINAGYQWRNFYVRGDANRNIFGGWQGSATGRDREWHPKEQWMQSGTLGYRGENTHIYYRIDHSDEWIDNKANFNGKEAIDQEYTTLRTIHQMQADTKLGDKLSLHTSTAYTVFSRKTRSIVVNRDTGSRHLAPGEGRQDANHFDGFNVRTVLNYRPSLALKLQQGFDMNGEYGEGGRLITGRQKIEDYAAFLSAEYAPFSFVKIRPGLRTMYNTAFEAPPILPSLNTRFQLHSKVDLKAAYARGYRAPSIRELYFFFFDASHAIEGNPALAPERSHSWNASLTYEWLNKEKYSLSSSVNGFYNAIDNMIGMGQTSRNTVTYINVDRFSTQGLVWNNVYRRGPVEVQGGVSYIGRFNSLLSSNAQEQLEATTWTTEANVVAAYHFKRPDMHFNFFYKYTGALPFYELSEVAGTEVIRLATIAAYHWADLSLSKGLGQYVKLQAGVRNVFNVVNVQNTAAAAGAHNTGGPRPIGYGRSYFLGLQFNLTN